MGEVTKESEYELMAQEEMRNHNCTADLSLALDLLPLLGFRYLSGVVFPPGMKGRWHCRVCGAGAEERGSSAAYRKGIKHKPHCTLAQLLARHGREVRWAE